MDSSVTIEEEQRAKKLCREYLGGFWTQLPPSQIKVTSVSGGMTNLLYLCALISDNSDDSANETNPSIPRQALLRIYGPAHSDTETQLEIFKRLADEKLGPKLYATFEGGRFEEYLPSRPLLWNEMINESIFAVVARKIAAIQKLNVKSLDKRSIWLLDRYREHYDYIVLCRKKTPFPPELYDADALESTRLIAKELSEIDFNTEIEFLESLFETSKAPLVFSHNDLHQNNIILLHQDKDLSLPIEDRIVLIDFEYCSYNYRTFDAANFLCEWCFDYNGDQYPHFSYSKERFPSDPKQKEFLTHFARHMLVNIDKNHSGDPSKGDNDNLYSMSDQNGSIKCTSEILDKTVDKLFDEMQPFLMASNLLWTIWAIKSAYTSKIKFGYWEMAKAKYTMYLLCKENFLKRTRNNYGCDGNIKVQSSKM